MIAADPGRGTHDPSVYLQHRSQTLWRDAVVERRPRRTVHVRPPIENHQPPSRPENAARFFQDGIKIVQFVPHFA